MSNQYLKLRRSAIPGKIPETSSIDYGEIALNTYDGLAFIKKSGSFGEEIVTIGSGTSTNISGSNRFIPVFSGSNSLVTSSIWDSGSITIIGATQSVHPSAPERLAVYAGATDSYNLISGHSEINNYSQLNIKNFSSGVSASSDIVATADNGDESSGFIDIGINSSGYTNTSLVGTARDAYVYSTGNDLLIGNASPNKKVIIFNGGNDALANARVYINDQGSVGINSSNITSGNPEALLVQSLSATTYNLITARGGVDNYLQMNIKNTYAGGYSSADIVATADNGTEFINFVDLGINSSAYNQTNIVGGPNDAYLYSTGRHLHIGNASTGDNAHVYLFSGGPDVLNNTRIFISSSGLVGFNTQTPEYNVDISGSARVTEQFIANNITGSLFGTSSWAQNSLTSSYIVNAVSSSYAATASSADNFTVRGTLTAQTIVAQTITSSVEFITGSTKFGSLLSNTHQFTGSVSITGSLTVNSSNVITENQTSSMSVATASYVLNAVSSSFASTASYALSVVTSSLTGSFVTLNTIQTISGSKTFSPTITATSGLAVGTNFTPTLSSSANSNTLVGLDITPTFFTGSFTVGSNLAMRVRGNTVIYGGNDTYDYPLIVNNIAGTTRFAVRNDGVISVGGQLYVSSIYGSGGGVGSLLLSSNGTGTVTINGYNQNTILDFGNSGANETQTSGICRTVLIGLNFTPTSGTAQKRYLEISPTINQTGGANGIIRGLYLNPTLTAAADWRSIETTNNTGYALYLSGSASSYIAGNVGIGTTGSSHPLVVNTAASSIPPLRVSDFYYDYYIGYGASVGASKNSNYVQIYKSSDELFIGSNTGGPINLFLGGTNVAKFYNNSLVLGGSSNSGYRLDTIGSARITSGLSLTGSLLISGSSIISGSLTVTEGITGSLFGTSSWAQNAITASYITSSNIAGIVTSASYALTASYWSGSILNATSASYAATASFAPNYVLNSVTASMLTPYVLTSVTSSMLSPYVLSSNTGSFITNSQTSSMSVLSASYAITASSADNFTVRGTLTAQTIVAQTITSSIEFITGSTKFGSLLANTHQFTGSVSMTGSLTVNDSSVILTNQTSSMSVLSSSYAATSSNILGGATNYIPLWLGSTNLSSSAIYQSGSNIGLGTTSPTNKLDISGSVRITGNMNMTGNITFPIHNTYSIGTFNERAAGVYSEFFYTGASSANVFGIRGFSTTIGLTIGLNTYSTANSSAILELIATTRGFLPPRMTAAQRIAITTPAQGLLVYDTGSITEGLWLYNSGLTPGWQEVLTNSGSQSISGSLTVTGSTNIQSLNLGASQFNNTSSVTSAGTTIISQLATGSYTSCFYNYTIASASNARSGQVMSVWNGATIKYTEVTTTDIGNTATASFAVALSGANVQLNFTAPGSWTVKNISNLL